MKKAAIVIRCVSIKEIIINGLDKSVIDGLKNELNSADGIDLINSKNELTSNRPVFISFNSFALSQTFF